MFLGEQQDSLSTKWQSIIEHKDIPNISDKHKRDVTIRLLENQWKDNQVNLREFTSPTNQTGSNIDNWDPILISLVRQAAPNLMAFDIAGVQPMSGPAGLIFSMQPKYTSQGGADAWMNNSGGGAIEPDTDFSSRSPAGNGSSTAHSGNDPFGTYTTGQGLTTAQSEGLGDGTDAFPEMAFTITKSTVTAVARAMKAEYSLELSQDLKAIHGLDAESELANMLSTEIMAEMNREIVRMVLTRAKAGAQSNTATAGIFDLDADSSGRWSVEKFKGLMFQVEREANQIAADTRRGRGNFIICSADVASALAMAGNLDNTPALQGNNGLTPDVSGSTFVGTLNKKYKVFIDPYFSSSANNREYFCVGYKGSNPWDAGIYYCPYVPLQMMRAVGENDFQPKIGFKTRYGLANNPFVDATNVSPHASSNANFYYRKVDVRNIL